MMEIKMTDLSYSFNDNGEAVGTSVSFSGNEGASFINGTINLNSEDLTDKQSFTDLPMSEIANIARTKFANFTAMKDK